MITQQEAVTFRYSRGKLVGLLAMSIAVTILFALFAFGIFEIPESSRRVGTILREVLPVIIPLGLVIMGAVSVYYFARLFHAGDVIVVNKEGIKDSRIGPGILPWSKLVRVSLTQIALYKFCQVVPDSEFERGFTLTRMTKLKKALNFGHGPEGHTIQMQGLTGTIDDLWAVVNRFCPREIIS